MNMLQPYIGQGLTIIVQIVALFVFYGLTVVKKQAEVYLAAHLDTKQMEFFHLLGAEAFAFAETAFKELKGADKMSVALDYFQKKAAEKGIEFDASAAKIAIEKAWLQNKPH